MKKIPKFRLHGTNADSVLDLYKDEGIYFFLQCLNYKTFPQITAAQRRVLNIDNETISRINRTENFGMIYTSKKTFMEKRVTYLDFEAIAPSDELFYSIKPVDFKEKNDTGYIITNNSLNWLIFIKDYKDIYNDLINMRPTNIMVKNNLIKNNDGSVANRLDFYNFNKQKCGGAELSFSGDYLMFIASINLDTFTPLNVEEIFALMKKYNDRMWEKSYGFKDGIGSSGLSKQQVMDLVIDTFKTYFDVELTNSNLEGKGMFSDEQINS